LCVRISFRTTPKRLSERRSRKKEHRKRQNYCKLRRNIKKIKGENRGEDDGNMMKRRRKVT
jgi:hypothetical protein